MTDTIATAYSTVLSLSKHYSSITKPVLKDDRQSHIIHASDLSPADTAYMLTEANSSGRTLSFSYELTKLHAIITYPNESTLTIVL